MRTYPKLRHSTTTLICIGCKEEKPVTEFSTKSKYSDGTARYKSRCRPCINKQQRVRIKRNSVDRIVRFEAPLSAAIRLMRQKPEVLAEIVRRYRTEYAPLLQEERERMLDFRQRQVAAKTEVVNR